MVSKLQVNRERLRVTSQLVYRVGWYIGWGGGGGTTVD